MGVDWQPRARRLLVRGAPPLSRRRGACDPASPSGIAGRVPPIRLRAAPQAKFPAAVTAPTPPGFPAGAPPCYRRTGESRRRPGTSSRSTRHEATAAGAAAERVTRPRAELLLISPPARGVPCRGPWLSRCREHLGSPKESRPSLRVLPFEVEVWLLVST